MTAPPPVEPPPPAPPVAETPSPAVWPTWFAAADRFTLVLLLIVAGLTACHVARNSDVWFHLAAGRDFSKGTYTLGKDPYSVNGIGRTWVNHAWLTDVLAYQLYKLAPAGELLILAKTALFTAAFALLLLLKKSGHSGWPWCVAVLIGIVAAAPQSVMRTPIISAVGVACTLVIVFNSPWGCRCWRRPAAIAVLFALWANLDPWFFLGPMIVAMACVGEALQKKLFKSAESGTAPIELLKALLLGTAATLLNPHHIGVWQLPAEMQWNMADMVTNDPRLRLDHLSPIADDYMKRTDLGNNANGLAFAVLFIGGGLLLAFSRFRLSLMIVWVAFAALALLQFRFILPFAIVGVPVVAVGLCDWTDRVRLGGGNEQSARLKLLFASILRPALVLLTIVAGVCAWPGWIHPKPTDPSLALRVGLSLAPDAGMSRTATGIKSDANILPATARVATVSLPLADYIAWHAPGVKVAMNHRMPFHTPESASHIQLRQAYGEQSPEAAERFATVLTSLNADVAVVTSPTNKAIDLPNVFRLTNAIQPLKVLHLDGRSVILSKSLGDEFAPHRMAFTGADLPTLDANYTPAPDRALANEVDDFLSAPKAIPLATLDATVWREYASALWQRRIAIYQDGVIGGTMAVAGPAMFAAMRMSNITPMPPALGDAVALNVMAIRAARQAIDANPDHPLAYYALGQAYNVSQCPVPGIDTADADAQRAIAFRRLLDRVPLPTAMNVTADAGMAWTAAEDLANHYRNNQAMDLWREMNKLASEYKIRAFSLVPRLTEEQMKQIKAEAESMEKKLQEIDKRFAGVLEKYQSTAGRPTQERLSAAMQLGLKGEAIKLIQNADTEKDFGENARQVEMLGIQLLVTAGRIEAAAEAYHALHMKVESMIESTDARVRDRSMKTRSQLVALLAELEHLAGNDAALINQLERNAPKRLSPGEIETVRTAIASRGNLDFRLYGTGHGALGGATGIRVGLQAEAAPVRQWESEGEAFTRLGVINLIAGRNREARRCFEQARTPEGLAIPEFLGGQNLVADFYLKLMK